VGTQGDLRGGFKGDMFWSKIVVLFFAAKKKKKKKALFNPNYILYSTSS
jgi:hypothetical protein